MLLTCLLPFLATEGSRVLEKKENETQVSKTVFSYLKYQQTHILPAYTIYIYSVLSWQCITGQFQMGCFWLFCDRRETLLPCFDSYFSRQKRKKTRLTVVFTLIYCVTDFDRFHEKHLSRSE